jgi:hypothetical protein
VATSRDEALRPAVSPPLPATPWRRRPTPTRRRNVPRPESADARCSGTPTDGHAHRDSTGSTRRRRSTSRSRRGRPRDAPATARDAPTGAPPAVRGSELSPARHAGALGEADMA